MIVASFKNVSTTHCPEDLAKYLKIPEDGTKRRDIRVMLIFKYIITVIIIIKFMFAEYVIKWKYVIKITLEIK